jgi:hypothetical protein
MCKIQIIISQALAFDGVWQRQIFKFLRLKNLKRGELAPELSSSYRQEASASSECDPDFIKSSSEELILERNMLLDDQDSTTLKFCHFCELSLFFKANNCRLPTYSCFNHLFSVSPEHWSLPFLFQAETIWTRRPIARMLKSQQAVRYRDIMTSGEPGFLQRPDHRRISCVSDDAVSTRVTHTEAAAKSMLTVWLTIDCAILINWLQPGEKLKSGSFSGKYGSQFPRSCTVAALQELQGG